MLLIVWKWMIYVFYWTSRGINIEKIKLFWTFIIISFLKIFFKLYPMGLNEILNKWDYKCAKLFALKFNNVEYLTKFFPSLKCNPYLKCFALVRLTAWLMSHQFGDIERLWTMFGRFSKWSCCGYIHTYARNSRRGVGDLLLGRLVISRKCVEVCCRHSYSRSK